MQTLISKYNNSFTNLLFPVHCFGCDKITEGFCLCNECKGKIDYKVQKSCSHCGKIKSKCECNCRAFHFDGVVSPFENSGIAKQGMYNIKFFGETNNFSYFATEMVNAVYDKFPDIEFDCITYVPARFSTFIKRKYNQSEILAKEISLITGIKIKNNLLVRKSFSKTQHHTGDIKSRFENAEKSYKSTGLYPGKCVLLVDDIKTTGATLDKCSKLLKQSGAQKVFCVCATIA